MSIFSPPTLKDKSRWDGLRIGLLGGSFNPAHKGHRHIALTALAKLKLDFVWWIVTPQNPLKQVAGMAPYDDRYTSVERIIGQHPRMMATHLERDLGTRYTYDTVRSLKEIYGGCEFTWICGMDNALIFHKWDHWKDLIKAVPVVFIARPPAGMLVRSCPVRLLGSDRTDWIQTNKMVDISSTQIRNSNKTDS